MFHASSTINGGWAEQSVPIESRVFPDGHEFALFALPTLELLTQHSLADPLQPTAA